MSRLRLHLVWLVTALLLAHCIPAMAGFTVIYKLGGSATASKRISDLQELKCFLAELAESGTLAQQVLIDPTEPFSFSEQDLVDLVPHMGPEVVSSQGLPSLVLRGALWGVEMGLLARGQQNVMMRLQDEDASRWPPDQFEMLKAGNAIHMCVMEGGKQVSKDVTEAYRAAQAKGMSPLDIARASAGAAIRSLGPEESARVFGWTRYEESEGPVINGFDAVAAFRSLMGSVRRLPRILGVSLPAQAVVTQPVDRQLEQVLDDLEHQQRFGFGLSGQPGIWQAGLTLYELMQGLPPTRWPGSGDPFAESQYGAPRALWAPRPIMRMPWWKRPLTFVLKTIKP